MTRPHVQACLALSAAALLAPVAPSQESIILVTGARLPAAPSDAAFSIETLDRTDLAEAAGLTLDQILRTAPGFSLFRRSTSLEANPTSQGASLRGIGPNGAGRALVLLDDAPQNDPFGGWIAWSALPAARIERVEIRRGGGAGPFGAGALTGVVSLESRSGDRRMSELSLAAGERGAVTASLSVAPAPPGRRIRPMAGIAWTMGQGGPAIDPARRGEVDEDLAADTRAAWLDVQKLTIAGAESAISLAGFSEHRATGVIGGSNAQEGLDASLRMAGGGAAAWRLVAWAKTRNLRNQVAAANPARTTSTVTLDQVATPARAVGGLAAVRARRGDWTLETGLDMRIAQGETREFFRNQGQGFTRSRIAGGRQTILGAYGEASRAAGPWTLSAAARADAWRNDAAKRHERDTVTGAVTLNDPPPARDGAAPTARLGVAYALSPYAAARASAYSGFRPPTLNELHRPFRVGNDVTEANGALAAERLFGAEIGYEGRFANDALSIDIGIYWNRLTDAIGNVTIAQGPGTYPRVGFLPAGGALRERRNLDAVEAIGLEVTGDWAITTRWGVDFGLAWSDAEVSGGASARDLTGKRPAQTPQLQGRLATTWRSEDWRLLAGLSYIGDQFEDDLNTRILRAATTLDARIEHAFPGGLSLVLSGDNLTDEAVAVGVAGDGLVSLGAPRRIMAGIILRGD